MKAKFRMHDVITPSAPPPKAKLEPKPPEPFNEFVWNYQELTESEVRSVLQQLVEVLGLKVMRTNMTQSGEVELLLVKESE